MTLMKDKGALTVWTGARDEARNGQYNFVGSGAMVPEELWAPGAPGTAVGNCVYFYEPAGKLYAAGCTNTWIRLVVCEMFL